MGSIGCVGDHLGYGQCFLSLGGGELEVVFLKNDDPLGLFAINDALWEDVLHQIRVSDHSSFVEQDVVVKVLDLMDDCKSIFRHGYI